MDLVGVQTAGQIVQCHLQDVLADLLRVIGVVRQGLRVSNHNIDLVELAGVLQAHALLQRANVVANMQAARGTVAGQNDLFHCNSSPQKSPCSALPFPKNVLVLPRATLPGELAAARRTERSNRYL